MKSNTFKNSLSLMLSLSLGFLLTACGGGDGGSKPVYINVISWSPINVSESKSSISSDITVDFDRTVAPNSLINESAKVGPVIELAGLSLFAVDKNGEVINSGNPELSATVNAVTLQELLANKYKLAKFNDSTSFYDYYISNSFDYQRVYDEIAHAVSYKIFAKAEGGAALVEIAQVSLADVKAAGVDLESDVFVVTGSDGTRALIGSVQVNQKQIIFSPDRFLDWSTTYTVNVKNGIKSVDGKNLKAAHSWSFTTEDQPDPAVTDFYPIGSIASPIQPITASVNFDISENVNVNDFVVVKKVLAPGNKPVVTGNVSYNKAQRKLSFVPTKPTAGYLDYGYKYEVTVREGLGGQMGNTLDSLAADHVWSFNTAPPRVDSYSPVGSSEDAKEIHPDIIDSTISVLLNFVPHAESFVSDNYGNIVFRKVLGGSEVSATKSFNGGLITVTPTAPLEYNTQYEVLVKRALYADLSKNIHLPADHSWRFTTQEMKIVSHYPQDGTSTFGIGETIEIEFNFDVNANMFNTNEAMRVQYQEDKGTGNVQLKKGYGTVSSSNPRLATFSVSGGYEYDREINVDLNNAYIENATTGEKLSGSSLSLKFSTSVEFMGISSVSPGDFWKDTDVWPLIYAKFITNIKDSSVNYNSIIVRDCDGDTISGNVYASGQYLYFNPNNPLNSYCNHTVTVAQSIQGTNNEKRDSTYVWEFTTGGLSLDFTTLTYTDFWDSEVDVDTSIVLDFNIDVYITDVYAIELEDQYYNTIYVSAYTYGDELRIDAINGLDYDTSYTLRVWPEAIEGNNGERISRNINSGSPIVISFTTEPDPYIAPIYITGYGPVDNVDNLGIFSVDFDQDIDININNINGYVEEISGYGGYVTNYNVSANVYTNYQQLVISTDLLLKTDAFYRITASGSNPDFYVSWEVDTFYYANKAAPSSDLAGNSVEAPAGTAQRASSGDSTISAAAKRSASVAGISKKSLNDSDYPRLSSCSDTGKCINKKSKTSMKQFSSKVGDMNVKYEGQFVYKMKRLKNFKKDIAPRDTAKGYSSMDPKPKAKYFSAPR